MDTGQADLETALNEINHLLNGKLAFAGQITFNICGQGAFLFCTCRKQCFTRKHCDVILRNRVFLYHTYVLCGPVLTVKNHDHLSAQAVFSGFCFFDPHTPLLNCYTQMAIIQLACLYQETSRKGVLSRGTQALTVKNGRDLFLTRKFFHL